MNRPSLLFQRINDLPTWMLLVSSGFILGFSFPPNPVGWFLGGIGLVPLLLAVERTTGWWQTARWSYVTFVIFSFVTTWWVGSWQEHADPWLMVSSILLMVIHPLFFVVPILLYRAVRQRAPLWLSLVFLVLLWTGGEYLHALTDASYPWLTLGNSQTYNPTYIQFIEFTGVWGLSFLMVIHNATVMYILSHLGADTSERSGNSGFRTAVYILLATIILPHLYGLYVLSTGAAAPDVREVRLTIVQPNQNPWDKWQQDDTVDHIDDHFQLSNDAGATNATDYFLWAENAIPYPVMHENWTHRRQQMLDVVDSLGVPVITGLPDYVIHPDKDAASPSSRRDSVRKPDGTTTVRYWDYYNSVGVFVPGVGLTGTYHKSQLVPFGERIPFVDLAPFLIDLLSWDVGISAWGKGAGPHALALPPRPPSRDSIRFGGMVCFESVYPNMVRKFVDDGAEFLTIVTNDGWYLGTPGPLQHERFAILRAVETRRAIARAANTGISCFINPDGTITKETVEGERTTITASIPLLSRTTVYVRFGDWLPILCLLGAAGLGGWSFVTTRSTAATQARP